METNGSPADEGRHPSIVKLEHATWALYGSISIPSFPMSPSPGKLYGPVSIDAVNLSTNPSIHSLVISQWLGWRLVIEWLSWYDRDD